MDTQGQRDETTDHGTTIAAGVVTKLPTSASAGELSFEPTEIPPTDPTGTKTPTSASAGETSFEPEGATTGSGGGTKTSTSASASES